MRFDAQGKPFVDQGKPALPCEKWGAPGRLGRSVLCPYNVDLGTCLSVQFADLHGLVNGQGGVADGRAFWGGGVPGGGGEVGAGALHGVGVAVAFGALHGDGIG